MIDVEELLEMANIRKADLDLPINIYLGDKGIAIHVPAMKAQSNYGDRFDKSSLFAVTIEDEPKVKGDTGKLKLNDVKKIQNFVKENKELLLKYWNGEISIFEFMTIIKKV